MHEESCQISFPVPSLHSLLCSTNSLSGLQSKDSVRVSNPVMPCCVRGDARQETLIHDRGVARMASWWVGSVGAVTKCSSQALPMDHPSSYESWRPDRGILRPASATIAALHMHISVVKRHSLTNKMLNRVSTETKQCKREIRPQHRSQTSMSGVPTDNIQPAGEERERARTLPQQPFSQLSAVQWRKKMDCV